MSTVGFKSISASGGASGSRGLGSRGQVKGSLRSQSAFQPGTVAASGGDGEVSRSTELNSLLAGLRSKGRLGGGSGTPTPSLAKTKRDEAEEDDEFARLERTLDEEARVRSRSTTGGEKVRSAPVVAASATASQQQPQQEKPRTPALRLPSRTAVGTRAASAVPQPCTPPSGGGRGGATGLRTSSPSFTLPRTRTPAFGKKSSNEEKDETAEFERLEAELALASARRKETAATGGSGVNNGVGGGGSSSTRGVVSRSPAVRGGAFKPTASSAARQPRAAAPAAAPAPVVAAAAAAAPPTPEEDPDVPPVIPVFRRVAAPPPRLVHSSNPPPLTRSEQQPAARPQPTSSFLSSPPSVAAADSPPHTSSATATAAESSAPAAAEQTRKPVALSFGLGRQQTPPPAASTSSSGLNIPQNIVLRRHADPAASAATASPTPKAAAPAALTPSSAFTRPSLASTAAASAATPAPAPAPAPEPSSGSGIIIPQNIFLRRPAAPPVVGGGGARSSPPSAAAVPAAATAPAVSAATPQAARRQSESPAAAPSSPAAVSQPRSRRVVRKSLEYEPTAGAGAGATPASSAATPPPRRSVSSAAVPSPDSVVVLTPPLHTRSESPPRPAPEDDVAYLDYIERLVKSLQAGEAPPSDGGLQSLFSSPLRPRGGSGARGDAYEKLCNEILPGLQKSTGNLTLTDSQKQELRAKLTLIRDTLSEPESGGGAAAAVAAAAEDENWLLSNDSFGKVGDVVTTTPAASPAVTPPTATTPAKGRESAGSHGIRARSEPHSRHVVGRPRVAAAAAERESRSLHPRDSTTSIVTAGSSHAGSTAGATAKQRSRSQGGPVKALEMKIESQDKKLQRQEKKVRTLKAENTELALRVKALTFEREKGAAGGGRTTPVSSSVLGRSEASLRDSAGALSRQSQSSSGVTPVSVSANRPTTPALRSRNFLGSREGTAPPVLDRDRSPRVTPASRLNTPGPNSYLGPSSSPGDVSFLQNGAAATGGGSVPRKRAAPA